MKKTVILAGGKISSGKNTAYDAIVELLPGVSVERKYFAYGVKTMSEEVFGRYVLHLNKTVAEVIQYLKEYDDDVANEPAIDRLETLLIKPENWYEDKTESTRILLQTVGADIIRNHVDKDFWVKRVAEEIRLSTAKVIVITDFRYENEFYALRYALERDLDATYNIVAINLVRNTDTSNELIHSHESENGLDNFAEWYATVENNGSLQELKDKLSTVIKSLEV